jgi:hypothetical protein
VNTVRPERDLEPGQLPGEPRTVGSLGREQRQLLALRHIHQAQLQLQPGDGGRGRSLLETGEEQPLDRLGIRRGLREALFETQPGRGASTGEREIVGDGEAGEPRGLTARRQLVRES